MICDFCGNVSENKRAVSLYMRAARITYIDCPLCGCALSMSEIRAAVMEQRYNHNHDSKGRFCSGSGESGSSAKPIDKSGESGKIRESGIHAIGDDNSEAYEPYSYEVSIIDEFRNIFNAEYAEAEKRFGKISTITGVQVLNDRSSDEGTYNDNSGFISIRHAEKKNVLKTMAAIAQVKYKEGKWSSGNPHHVIRHEIGHAIQQEHFKNDVNWGSKQHRILEIMRKASESKDGYCLPSKYSSDRLEEFISECIAASYKKSPGKTVTETISIINEV